MFRPGSVTDAAPLRAGRLPYAATGDGGGDAAVRDGEAADVGGLLDGLPQPAIMAMATSGPALCVQLEGRRFMTSSYANPNPSCTMS
jgi:hypothetical protein